MIKFLKVFGLKRTIRRSLKRLVRIYGECFQEVHSLGLTHSKWAISPLIGYLQDKELRSRAALALGELGIADPIVLAALIELLRLRGYEHQRARDAAAIALSRLGWEPETDSDAQEMRYVLREEQRKFEEAQQKEVVHARRNARDYKWMDENWALVLTVARREVQSSQSLEAATLLIDNGDPQDESVLISALNRGTIRGHILSSELEFAKLLLNCGNKKLQQATQFWASMNDCYTIRETRGGAGAVWGSKKGSRR